jgi:uncharacterized RDD family membrane protein YckC
MKRTFLLTMMTDGRSEWRGLARKKYRQARHPRTDQALQEHWLRRFVAIILDSLLIYVPLSILVSVAGGWHWYSVWWWAGALLFLYATLFDAQVGGTVGKLIMRLKVVPLTGQLTTPQALLRNVTKVFGPILLIDWIIGMAVDTHDPRQKWTDQMAHTSVIRTDIPGRT